MSTKKEPKELAKQFYTVMYRMRRFEEEVFEFYKRGLMPGLAHLYLGGGGGGRRGVCRSA